MAKTKLLYLTDSYLQKSRAKVVSISKKGSQTAVTLNQTIFYPQGGGQPSDFGTISGKNGSLTVTQVNHNGGQLLHLGKLKGTLKKNASVELEIDWKRRFHNMRLHSAGHILHEAVMTVAYGIEPVSGTHGIGGKIFIKYKGIIDRTLIPDIHQKANQLVASNKKITTEFVTPSQLKKKSGWIPKNLPTGKPLRIAQISGFDAVPDGGTQVKSTTEVGTIKITDIDYDDGHSLVKYNILSQSKSPKISASKTVGSITDFSTNIKSIEKKAIDAISSAKPSQKEKLRVKYLGRQGEINSLTKAISLLPGKNRGQAGQQLNKLKLKIQTALAAQGSTIHDPRSKTWLDVTIPGKVPPQGHLHPITQAIDEITRIFSNIGFTRVRYPEVDWDYYVFESLNMPPDHPARDEWETFFIDAPAHRELGSMVLTTHTSNGQVREMERVKTPPIRMLNIAKCYRRQQDVTHTAMFHQFEGLVIDEGINIQHLKGTLDYFARKFYGPQAHSRIRPFMFKFTEPSFEVDFSCTHCQGKARLPDGQGCRFCKSGWHEVGGAGMVHPNVLKAGGIDPNKFTGFAFGWGVERVYTLKPGLKLDDIRPLYTNNLNFLNQF